jgi:hypothetical protein
MCIFAGIFSSFARAKKNDELSRPNTQQNKAKDPIDVNFYAH